VLLSGAFAAEAWDSLMKSLLVDQYYVYIYRDEGGRVRYVGYGKSSNRPSSHLSGGSHSPALNDFLAKQKYSLEIAGPFESNINGLALETALISALKPDLNDNLGPARWRFRPLSVPEQFAERLALPPLERKDFVGQPGGVLFVHIKDTDYDQIGRAAAGPTNDSRMILERLCCCWQLGTLVKLWLKDHSTCPSILVGVSGHAGSQIIVGAAKIDRTQWQHTWYKGMLYNIPTAGPEDLDALELRGRQISRQTNLKFGSRRHQVFLILTAKGKVVFGGGPSSS
jgi:hypothetical protein